MSELKIIDNKAENRFEAEIEDHLAIVEYIRKNGKIFVTHTEVPKALEGKGYGSKLVVGVLTKIEEEREQLVALCPFVRAYLMRHPEWNRLLNPPAAN